jgi:hypothetical protein
VTAPVNGDRPRLDPYLVTLGERYEDVSGVAAAQPFRSAGPTLHRDAVTLLAATDPDGRGRRTGMLGRIRGLRGEDALVAELVAAELMTPSGELTDSGRLVAAALTRPTAHVRVESARGRTPLALAASALHGQAAVVATASPAALGEEPRGEQILDTATTVTLDWIDVSFLPVMIASWVGLAPAWSLATEPELLPEQLVTQRADDPATPPPVGADQNLRHAWEQPWHLWTMRAEHVAAGRILVNAGRAGHFMLLSPDPSRAAEGLVLFRATPAANVWLDLVSYIQQELNPGGA